MDNENQKRADIGVPLKRLVLPQMRDAGWLNSCDHCQHQEGRHYCLLHSVQIKNMDTKRCDEHEARKGLKAVVDRVKARAKRHRETAIEVGMKPPNLQDEEVLADEIERIWDTCSNEEVAGMKIQELRARHGFIPLSNDITLERVRAAYRYAEEVFESPGEFSHEALVEKVLLIAAKFESALRQNDKPIERPETEGGQK